MCQRRPVMVPIFTLSRVPSAGTHTLSLSLLPLVHSLLVTLFHLLPVRLSTVRVCASELSGQLVRVEQRVKPAWGEGHTHTDTHTQAHRLTCKHIRTHEHTHTSTCY